jgi:non-ribosomal peptide synthetase component F
VARWATYYGRLLEAVVEAPTTPVSRLPLLSPEERRDLLENWSGRDVAVPERLVHKAFAEMARARPDAPALTMGGETLTYAEIDARAERLARRIVAHLTGAEPVVGICLERSIAQIVAVLAAFKAGAACLPLDPHYPASRLAYMIEDADAPVIVTSGSLLGRLPIEGRTVLDADDGDDGPTEHPTPSGTRRAGLSDLTPRERPHPPGACHRAWTAGRPHSSHRRALRDAPDDRFLQAASLNFDYRGSNLRHLRGRCRIGVLLPPERPIPWRSWRSPRRHGLTVLNLPPALGCRWCAPQGRPHPGGACRSG